MAQYFTSEELNDRFTKKKHVEKVKTILTNFSLSEEDFENSYMAAEYANSSADVEFLLQKLYDDFVEKQNTSANNQ